MDENTSKFSTFSIKSMLNLFLCTIGMFAIGFIWLFLMLLIISFVLNSIIYLTIPTMITISLIGAALIAILFFVSKLVKKGNGG